MAEKIMAGFGRIDVSPQLGISLGGYAIEDRVAEDINDPLYATSLVLKQGDLKVAIITLDWVCVEAEEVALIRQQVNKSTGIAQENITICATHTHNSPNTISARGWGKKERGYIDEMIPKIADSTIEANKTLASVRVGIATTQSKVGINRRGVLEDKFTEFLADPNGSYDPTMTVIRFEGDNGPVGTVIHCSAHGTATGPLPVVSRDWPGAMVDRIEQQTNAPTLFINGTFGDTGPRTNAIYPDGVGFCAGSGDGLTAAAEVGLRAASDALWAWLSIREFRDDLILKALTQEISFPYDSLPPLEQAEKELAACEKDKDLWGEPMCNYQYWKHVVDAHAKPLLKDERYFQTITCLGSIAIVPIPGEPFSDIGLRLRRFSPFAYTLCAGGSNGSNGYFVTREARHRGGYELWVARAYKTYIYVDNIDDILVEENLKLLRQI